MFKLDIRQKLLLLVFFFSGFAALLYQVIWQRWLIFFTGISTISLSLIISAFMAGLGLGYLAGGLIADRCSENRTIRFFVLAEIGIGIFALLSKWIIYDQLYSTGVLQSSSHFQLYLILSIVLLFPTFLMGLSLPLLSKAFKLSTIENQSSFVSLLYFVNNLGAATGALLTGSVLIRWIGFQQSVFAGAGLNFACAAVAGLIYHSTRIKTDPLAASGKKLMPVAWNQGHLFWFLQYALSGFFAISFEILWFRLLDVIIKSVAVTFSIILAMYLASMAIGTSAGVFFVRHTRYRLKKIFLLSQYVMYLYTVGSILLLWWAIAHVPSLSFLYEYLRSYGVSFSPNIFMTTYVFIPLLLMAVPTFLMGFCFSVSQAIVQDDFTSTGRKVGALQFSNIAGSVLGAWFVSLIGFNYLGSSLTIRVLGIVGGVYLLLLLNRRFINAQWGLAMSALLAVTIVLFPNQESFWMVFSGVENKDKMIFNENHSALSLIKIEEIDDKKAGVVFVNGMGQSILPYDIDGVHMALGAIGALIHPDPKSIAVIGLGSGGTLYGISSRPQTKRIDCFEIIDNQPLVLKEFGRTMQYPFIPELLNDKRIRIIPKDGRYELQTNPQTYDLIEADALRPNSSYAGNIYSTEYFAIVKSRLNKGGLAAAWMPTERVRRTFLSVFPYAFQIGGFLLVGSNEPITINIDEIGQRLETPFTRDHFAKANINISSIMASYFSDITAIQSGSGTPALDVNTDMFPRDEFNFIEELYRLTRKRVNSLLHN